MLMGYRIARCLDDDAALQALRNENGREQKCMIVRLIVG